MTTRLNEREQGFLQNIEKHNLQLHILLNVQPRTITALLGKFAVMLYCIVFAWWWAQVYKFRILLLVYHNIGDQ